MKLDYIASINLQPVPPANNYITLPLSVQSRDKKGGMGKGLSRKIQIVTETSTKETPLNLGEKGPPAESMPWYGES